MLRGHPLAFRHAFGFMASNQVVDEVRVLGGSGFV